MTTYLRFTKAYSGRQKLTGQNPSCGKLGVLLANH